MSNFWGKRKSIASLQSEASSENGLKRSLSSTSLVALGIGAIIGAGLFSLTGFSSKADEQSGNYIALNVDPASGFPESMTVEVKNGTSGPVSLTAEDHQALLKIKDAAKQSIIIKATNNGSEVTKEYNFVGLTLQTA